VELIEQLSKLAKFRKFYMFFPRLPENGLPSQTIQGAEKMEKLNLPHECPRTKTHVMATTELTTKGKGERATTIAIATTTCSLRLLASSSLL